MLAQGVRVNGLMSMVIRVVDKLIRYETTIERQLYRAMHQLERLQRRKVGEAVPPPVSVEPSH